MAWWNQPAGTLTPSVTAERVAAWFASWSYGCDLEPAESSVYTVFAGTEYRIRVVGGQLMLIQARHVTGLATDQETVERVRATAREVVDAHGMPAACVMVHEDGLVLHAKALVSIGAGLNDEQLAGALDFSLDGTDTAVREILRRLGLEEEPQPADDAAVEPVEKDDAAQADPSGTAGTAGSEEPQPADDAAVEPVEEDDAAQADPSGTAGTESEAGQEGAPAG